MLGVQSHWVADLYTTALRVRWPALIGWCLVAKAGIISLFWNFYVMHIWAHGAAEGLSGRQAVFRSLMFSISLSSGGDGDAHQPFACGFCLMTAVHLVVREFYLLLVTSVVLQRLASPRPPVQMSNSVVVNRFDGDVCLTARFALDNNPPELLDAHFSVDYERSIRLKDGTSFRRCEPLPLVLEGRARLSYGLWIRHVVSRDSPLWGKSHADLVRERATFQVVVTGMEPTTGQTVTTLKCYPATAGPLNAVLFDRCFVDQCRLAGRTDFCASRPSAADKGGDSPLQLVLDMKVLHDTEPALGAKALGPNPWDDRPAGVWSRARAAAAPGRRGSGGGIRLLHTISAPLRRGGSSSRSADEASARRPAAGNHPSNHEQLGGDAVSPADGGRRRQRRRPRPWSCEQGRQPQEVSAGREAAAELAADQLSPGGGGAVGEGKGQEGGGGAWGLEAGEEGSGGRGLRGSWRLSAPGGRGRRSSSSLSCSSSADSDGTACTASLTAPSSRGSFCSYCSDDDDDELANLGLCHPRRHAGAGGGGGGGGGSAAAAGELGPRGKAGGPGHRDPGVSLRDVPGVRLLRQGAKAVLLMRPRYSRVYREPGMRMAVRSASRLS